MTFNQFERMVQDQGLSLSELRCDVAPSEAVLEIMDRIGLDRYEQFVMRLDRAMQMREYLKARDARVAETDRQPLPPHPLKHSKGSR
jgi:hypothetical protein